MSNPNTSKEVDTYIAMSNPAAQPIMEELRRLIFAAVPSVEEGISYSVPFYKYHGEYVGFATYKSHVSFGFGAGVLGEADRAALKQKGYKLGKGTMQIAFGQQVPAAAVESILKTKAEINKTTRKIP